MLSSKKYKIISNSIKGKNLLQNIKEKNFNKWLD